MSIKLKFDEDFSIGIRRLILEECYHCLDHLENSGSGSNHRAVHEVRKSCKKIRAALRLIRNEIDIYKESNVFFRDIGRSISGIRDAQANLETLDEIYREYESHLYKNSFRSVRDGLLGLRQKHEVKLFEEEQILHVIKEKIEDKIREIKDWDLNINNFEQIRPGLKRVYKRGYKGLEKASASGSMENFHEWRKRVKYLRYQLDILNRTWPELLETLEDELHDITDWTGLDHDIYNLKTSVENLEEIFDNTEQERLFYALLNHHSGLMQELSVLKGDKFYRDTPKRFCDKMENYWRNHEKEINSEYKTLPSIVQ